MDGWRDGEVLVLVSEGWEVVSGRSGRVSVWGRAGGGVYRVWWFEWCTCLRFVIYVEEFCMGFW